MKVNHVTQKTELDRVNKNINNRFRVSLEPLDTKKLLRGNARETDATKWVSKKNFNPITSGDSHRRAEYSHLRIKEPYVTH